jgi:predicted flavoprotein YhiN
VEGGVIYAVSAVLRDVIAAKGVATLRLDLAPDRETRRLIKDLSVPRGKHTMATHLERRAGIAGVKAGLLREVLSKEKFADPVLLAAAIKSLPLRLVSPRPVGEAISTAGGVPFEELDERLMVRRMPGVFCAGEMLDWESPTGGYLLTACLATGRAAGAGAITWMQDRRAGLVSATRKTP